jgi:HEPN domain-containing protein
MSFKRRYRNTFVKGTEENEAASIPLQFYHSQFTNMLSYYQTDQLREVINIIIKATSPDKIFLLGAAQNCHTEESIFTSAPVLWQQVTHYYLMVLTKQNDGRCFDALHDVIESRCRHVTPVTVFMEAVHIFNQWINTGHPFANSIARNGLLLYDAETVPLEIPCIEINEPDIALQRKEFVRWNNQVSEFLAGTELYLLRKQFGLAAFLLHQAAEHACTVLLKLMTGYRAGTHNLDKLLRYCRPFSAELARLFPRDTEKENNLFQLLQKAYVHGRYRDDYVVTEKELRVLNERVQQLQLIVREIAEAKLYMLKAV